MGLVQCCGPASAPEGADNYLDWRSKAIVARLSHPICTASDSAALKKKVDDFLQDKDVVDKPAFTKEGVAALIPSGSDWRPFAHWLLERIKQVNELGGQRMQVVSWKTLKQLGHIPVFPEEARHVLDAEELLEEYIRIQDGNGKVDGRVICFSFFSHKWERPSLKKLEGRPDTEDNKKCHALAKFGEFGTCPIFAPNHDFDYYFWIDYSGVNQENDLHKSLGLTALSAYVAGCIQIIMYNSSTADYESSSWTRLERMLGYTYCACPLFKYLDDNYPTKPLDLDKVVARYPTAFDKDSSTETLLLRIKDPDAHDAKITNPEDKIFIRQLTQTVLQAAPLNPARVWNGVHSLDFERSQIPLDTKHYGMDVLKMSEPRLE